MTIIRTPRPEQPDTRRAFLGGTLITRATWEALGSTGRPDDVDRAKAAKLAVTARNNGTYAGSLEYLLISGRDRVSLEVIRSEHHDAVVCGFMGYRRPSWADLRIVVR